MPVLLGTDFNDRGILSIRQAKIKTVPYHYLTVSIQMVCDIRSVAQKEIDL